MDLDPDRSCARPRLRLTKYSGRQRMAGERASNAPGRDFGGVHCYKHLRIVDQTKNRPPKTPKVSASIQVSGL